MELKNNNAELILFLKNVGFDNYLKYLKSKLKNKRILIYGAGLLFQTIYSNYDLSNLNIVGISDMSFSAKSELNKTNAQMLKLLNELGIKATVADSGDDDDL